MTTSSDAPNHVSGNHAGTRERILAAAREVFAERGYDGASVRQIAARAGLTDPALYYYFDSKEALHRALLEVPDATSSLEQPRDTLADGIEQLVAFFDYHSERADTWRVAFHAQMSGDPASVAMIPAADALWHGFFHPFFTANFGERAADVEEAALDVAWGFFWHKLLTHGQQFESVAASEPFKAELRRLFRALFARHVTPVAAND